MHRLNLKTYFKWVPFVLLITAISYLLYFQQDCEYSTTVVYAVAVCSVLALIGALGLIYLTHETLPRINVASRILSRIPFCVVQWLSYWASFKGIFYFETVSLITFSTVRLGFKFEFGALKRFSWRKTKLNWFVAQYLIASSKNQLNWSFKPCY